MTSEYEQRLMESVQSYCQPLAGDSPAGADVSYDPQFEAAKAEIDKLTGLSGDQPDWREVVSIADRITRETSKDFRLLAWSTVARFHAQGLQGLGTGLAILRGVSETFWEPMFPPVRRAKARANLWDWMNEQVAALLQPIEPTAADGDALRTVQSLYDQLDSLLSDKLKDAYSGLGVLRSVLRDKVRAIPAEVVEAPAAPSPSPESVVASPAATRVDSVQSAASAGSAVAAEVPAMSGPDDVMPALRTLGKSVQEAARHLRRADPANAWAYRLQRTGLWIAVKAPPPAEASRTRIGPPPADLKKKLEAKMTSEQWMDLLASAEDATGTSIFWLDLHRYVALAMDRLGALFIEARATVGRQLVVFLEQCPTLPKLCFSDGTPFADAATQSFLEEEQSKLAGGGGGSSAGGGSSRGSEEDEELRRRFEEARELVSSGKLVEGLALAAQLSARAADERARFRGKLALAELALKGGKAEVGRPILEQLLDEVVARRLEEWEPGLAAAVCSGLVSAHRALGVSLDQPELKGLYDRLCRLDPASALRWSGS